MRAFRKGAAQGLHILAWLAALSIGPSAAADDFYKGKTINFIIGSAPGGGYDSYSRLVASHIGRHLAGQSDRRLAEHARRGQRQSGFPSL